ncbi:MAG: T9SS C-terminal target domain-containing protein, partial [Calditrichaeota bacterium]
EDNSPGIYYTYSYDGNTWSDPGLFKPVQVPGINSIKIIRDSEDMLHIVWQRPQPKALYYTQMDSALNITVDSVRIADNPANGSFQGIYLTVDRKNRLHVMWHDGDHNTLPTDCFYSRSTDHGMTWSAPQILSDFDDKASAFPRGQFNAYGGDSLVIAWRNFRTNYSTDKEIWDIQMVTSTDGGQSWSAVKTINQNDNFQGDPDVVIDPWGRIHMIYHRYPMVDSYNQMRIVYGYSDDLGATWLPSSTFNNIVSLDARSELAEGSHYQISTGALWTFWKDESEKGSGGGYDIMAAYSTDRGETWSSPEYVTELDSNVVGFKAVLVLEDGTIGINYEVPNYPTTGEQRVLYKERTPVITGWAESLHSLPETFELKQNFPNPFNPSTTIAFTLKTSAQVRLSVFDINGRPVARLLNERKKAGHYSLLWHAVNHLGEHLSAGIYFLHINVDDKYRASRKMILLP